MASYSVSTVILVLLVCSQGVTSKCDKNNFIKMLDCLPAAVGTGAVTSKCCKAALPYLSDPVCLCDTLIYAKSQIPAIKLENAVGIPKACGFSKYVPPGFTCQGLTIPT